MPAADLSDAPGGARDGTAGVGDRHLDLLALLPCPLKVPNEFVAMHAESRGLADPAAAARAAIARANALAGEPFEPATPVAALSGGQSRALMIADVACLSASPIVLIDEIENAGIDRGRAVQVLVDERKIVLLATHDPVLALRAGRRLVFRDGGVRAVLETSAAERASLEALEAIDARLALVRDALRRGERIDDPACGAS